MHAKAKTLAWASVALYVGLSGGLLLLGGCVKGEPFTPEMCVVRVDSLNVSIGVRTLRLCAVPRTQTKAKR